MQTVDENFRISKTNQKPNYVSMGMQMRCKENHLGGKVKYYIKKTCDEIKELLLKKNEAYGNSAADPVRIFSKVDALEQINVRIDDKLSRMMRGTEFQGDDTELDLIGYLILKRALKTYQKNKDIYHTPLPLVQ